jgi:hypothetical protein
MTMSMTINRTGMVPQSKKTVKANQTKKREETKEEKA